MLRIAFAATPDFTLPLLEAVAGSRHRLVAVYTCPDHRAGRGWRLSASPVKRRAEALGLPLEQPAAFDAEASARLQAQRPDLFIVAAYGLLLPPAALAAPALGCINLHLSLLPRWRGAAPAARAIEAGDAKSGISLMTMAERLDAGPVITQRSCAITHDETNATLQHKLCAMGAGLITEFLDRDVAAQMARAEPQFEAGACYAKKLSKHEAWIDWRAPAAEISRKVRALNPWPVAQTRFGGAVLRVWQARPVATASGAPGDVLAVDRGGIAVACGVGAVELTRVQLPGGKPMDGRAFANGHAVAGARLASPVSPQ